MAGIPCLTWELHCPSEADRAGGRRGHQVWPGVVDNAYDSAYDTMGANVQRCRGFRERTDMRQARMLAVIGDLPSMKSHDEGNLS